MKRIMFVFLVIIFLPIVSFAQGLENYIIQNDIGDYKFRPKPTKEIYGNSGVVTSADHFDEDHDDVFYVTRYIKPDPILGVDVQVTQHASGDSDRWLLHEVENGYRRSKELKATYSAPNPIRIIDNNKIWFQWGVYRWLSNNVVVSIDFTDLQGVKPEPIEVVKAYLQKFPSTITLTDAEIKSNAHNVQWIKDEMDRRLWLCDKWNAQFQAGKTTQKDLLYNLNNSLEEFLKYRQKYYGVSAKDDLAAIRGYMEKNDVKSIFNKLLEYKTWWNVNKGKSISI